MLKRAVIFATLLMGACASSPEPVMSGEASHTPYTDQAGVTPDGYAVLPDRVAYLQTDARWAKDRLGNTRSDTMGSDGCLVTAVAMAMTNLGHAVDPSRLNTRLTETGSYTPQGWLIWSGVEKVTKGKARAVYHDSVSPQLIRECMLNGQYPLVRFYLPNGRSHWAMIIAESAEGYRMRDPLRESRKPLIFPNGADAFKSLRCIGSVDSGRST
jgi:hypothetical protein